MSDGAALLHAILADPADDTARLVYADWLQENGEAPRAEFIREQIARPEWVVEASPHQPLLHNNRPVCPLPRLEQPYAVTVSRGFPSAVCFSVNHLRKAGFPLFALFPITAVGLEVPPVLLQQDDTHLAAWSRGVRGDRQIGALPVYLWSRLTGYLPDFTPPAHRPFLMRIAATLRWYLSAPLATAALSTTAVAVAREAARLPPLS